MAQCCSTRGAVLLWSIMLVIFCFLLFVAFGAVNPWPQSRQRQNSALDSSKELLLVHTVWIKAKLLFCAHNSHFISIRTGNQVDPFKKFWMDVQRLRDLSHLNRNSNLKIESSNRQITKSHTHTHIQTCTHHTMSNWTGDIKFTESSIQLARDSH